MGTFKYRESVDAPWQELPIIGNIYTQDVRPAAGGGGTPSSVYLSTDSAKYAKQIPLLIDVSNVSKVSFKYDYTNSKNSSQMSKFYLNAYKGYTLDKTSLYFNTKTLDASVATETIAANITTKVSGVEVEIDVSSYTSVVLSMQIQSQSTSVSPPQGSAILYDFVLS